MRVFDAIGCTLLSAIYLATAWLLEWMFELSLEQALLIVLVFAASQLRWYQKDKSPLSEEEKHVD